MLFPSHSLGVDLALNDLLRRLSGKIHGSRELLTARLAMQIPIREVFRNPTDDTLDESASPTFAILVEQCSTLRAMDRDGAPIGFIFARHGLVLSGYGEVFGNRSAGDVRENVGHLLATHALIEPGGIRVYDYGHPCESATCG